MTAAPGPPPSVRDLVTDAHVIVCCGTGGVGKTTTAAALALEAARAGRRVAVITIDPARRLADALGLTGGDTEVPRDRWDPDGTAPPGGHLTALMLDTSETFDGLVARYAADDEQRDRILENRFYRSLAGALSGTQEYMAMERLHELHESGAYDLVVVDTPPSRHALDFLDAPQRLLRLLDNRVFRLLMLPARRGLRVASGALHLFVRQVGRVVGTGVIDDVIAFFRAFEGMEEGFRDRADAVRTLLAEPSTRFVLVTSPRQDSIDEAVFFADRITEHGLAIDALVANRVHPRFGDDAPAWRARAAASRTAAAAATDHGAAEAGLRFAARCETVADLVDLAGREHAALARVADRTGAPVLVHVPFLAHDVHDVEALHAVGRVLVERAG